MSLHFSGRYYSCQGLFLWNVVMPKEYSKTKNCTIRGCNFISKHPDRRKCYDCGPLRKDRLPECTPPATEKKCSKCLKHKPLDEFNKCKKSRHGVVSECKSCRKKYRDSKQYILTCSSFNCNDSFISKRPVPCKCPKCRPVATKSSDALCRYVAPFYDNMQEFQDCHSGLYQHAEKVGILGEIREHMLPMDTPFSRGGFISRCDRNEGFGTFYLLKCHDDNESFYKFGITSRDVEARYFYETAYQYHTIISFEAPAGFVWDLERHVQRLVADIKYSPRIRFGGSTRECFKCNSNNKIFKNLLTIDPYLQSA